MKSSEAPPPDKTTAPEVHATGQPELVLQTGHASKVDAICFDPTGRLLATGGSDNTIKIWDAVTGSELRVLRGHGAGVAGLSFSGDGKLLLSGGNDRSARVWEVSTGRVVSVLGGLSASIKAVTFHPGGRLVALGGSDNTVKLWDFSTAGEARPLGTHAGWVVGLAFDPGGRRLASASLDGTVKLWDVEGGQQQRTLKGHADRVNTIAFSPDGSTLASGSSDKTVKIWDVARGRERLTLRGHDSKVIGLTFSGAGSRLLSVSANRTTKLWDVGPGRVLNSYSLDGDFEFEYAAFGRGGRVIASSNGNKQVVLRDADTGAALRTLDTASSSVYTVAFSPDFRWLATGNRDNSIKLWEVATGRELKALEGHSGWVTSLAFGPGRNELASGSLDGTVKVWDAATGSLVRTLVGHADSVYAVAFSPDGQSVATGSLDGSIMVWDAATGRRQHTLKGHSVEVTSVVFSRDGRRLISGGADKKIRYWDLTDGKEAQPATEHPAVVYALALSPDGTLIASGGAEQNIRVSDPLKGREVRSLKGHAGTINSLAFSPDGRWLASAGNDRTVRLWETATGREVWSLDGHADNVNSVAFSPDGNSLVSGSEDGSTRVWETATGRLRAVLTSLGESADWLVAAPGGLFDGSPMAWNKVLWRFDGVTTNVAPVEAFFNEFYYPGLLAEIFAGKSPAPAQVIALRDRRQPLLNLSMSPAGLHPGGGDVRLVKVRIEVAEAPPDEAHTEGGGARDLRLFRNGLLVRVWRGDVLVGGGMTVIETNVPVVAGENRFTAYAFNRDNVKSSDAHLTVAGGEELRRPGRLHVLAIGVNKYANKLFNLKYAVADVKSVVGELKRQQEGLRRYERVESTFLLDRDATKTNILRALADLSTRTQPEDSVLIYYAGHGLAAGNSFYLIPHDMGYDGSRTELSDADRDAILSHSISDRELELAYEEIDAGRILMVIDACNSGQALESEEKRRGPMNSKGLAQLAYEKGMYVLTAAQSYQAALEVAELGHGLLTYVLVEEGLKTAAADRGPKDGDIAADEWFDFAVGRVPELQRQKMLAARPSGLSLAFVEGEEGVLNPDKKSLQRPRVFYRDELKSEPLIVAKSVSVRQGK